MKWLVLLALAIFFLQGCASRKKKPPLYDLKHAGDYVAPYQYPGHKPKIEAEPITDTAGESNEEKN